MEGVLVGVIVNVDVAVSVGVGVYVIIIRPTGLDQSSGHLPRFCTPVGETVGVDVKVGVAVLVFVFVTVHVGDAVKVFVNVGETDGVIHGEITATTTLFDCP